MVVRALLLRHSKSAALIAGALSATGFEPLGLWPATLACLAVLILLVRDAPDRRSAFWRGWLFGLGHFTVGLNWIALAFTFQDAMPHWFGYGSVVLLSLYLALFPGFATLGAFCAEAVLRRRPDFGMEGAPADPGLRPSPERCLLILSLCLAATWLAAEYLRGTLFTGFAWNPLGAVMLPTGITIGATIVGTFGLSALAILAGGALALLLERRVRPAAIMAAPLLALALWGLLAPVPSPETGAPLVRVVQPNIGQDDKYSPALEQAHFRTLAALSGEPRPAPRLIFWPEDAIPAYLDMEPDWRRRVAALLGPGDLMMLGATKVYFKQVDKGGYSENVLAGANNSLWVVTPDARLAARYDKAHLVPYGEYLPMRGLLSAIGLSRLVPGDADFWPGPGPRTLTLPGSLGRPTLKMGAQICYEIIFPGHIIDAADRPAFLFNPSNDAWFGSWGPVQHLAQARLRAIEEGMPIIRSTPTGVSAIIDARGHIRAALREGRAGYLETALPPALPPTLFARLGNWASGILMVALFGLAIAMRAGRR